MKLKKENRGGSGRGQGRRLKYGEPTVKFKSVRIPKSFTVELTSFINKRLSEYEAAAKGCT